ncbi:MAG: hypothetical protein Q8Q36_01935 [bacterium]|nr:hypothetical protein [bacterium]
MGTIIDLAAARKKKAEETRRRGKERRERILRVKGERPGWYMENGIRSFRCYKPADIGGERPRGHRPPKYGPRGGVILGVGQVWVEVGLQHMWVIAALERRRDGKHTVHLRPYRCFSLTRTVSETTLRMCFMVWEKDKKDTEELAEDMRRWHPGWRGFFGLDPETGNRID